MRGLFAGLASLDVVHHVERPPGADEKVTAHRQDVGAGGPAAVAALAFAALGGDATLLTLLGSTPAAELVRADLAAGGVRVVDLAPQEPDSPQAWAPPVSAVRVSPSGRSVTSPDAAVAPEPVLPTTLPAVDVVLVDGHHAALARDVARAGIAPLLVDLGRPKPVFDEVLPHADVVVASAVNAGRERALLGAGPRAVAVTAGAGPVTWVTGAGAGEVPVEPVDAVDTLGAGDVFHGAVAFAMARDGVDEVVARFPDVLAWASRAAAVRVTTAGPHAWRTDPRLGRLVRG